MVTLDVLVEAERLDSHRVWDEDYQSIYQLSVGYSTVPETYR